MMRKLFFLNIIVFFTFFFSLEIIARIFHFADLTGISNNLIIYDNIRYTNAPNVEAYAFSKKVFTDKFGFRIPNQIFDYNEQNSSILVIGDSVSFGVGVDEQRTFIGLLRNEFKNLNFFNSSVSGYNLDDYSEVVKINKNLKGIKEVIFFFTLNDISFAETVLHTKDQVKIKEVNNNLKFFNMLRNNHYFAKLNIFLRNKSVFYMWIKGVITKPSERHFYYLYPLYQDEIKVNELRKAIEKLKMTTNENNFKLSIIVLPYEFQTRIENCNSNFLQPQYIVKDILVSLKIKFKDYTDIFCGYKKPSLFFLKYDPVHLSAEGHNLVFNLLKKDLNYLKNQ